MVLSTFGTFGRVIKVHNPINTGPYSSFEGPYSSFKGPLDLWTAGLFGVGLGLRFRLGSGMKSGDHLRLRLGLTST